MKRVAIFGSASCTGWAFSYVADDALQNMIRKHAERYNSPESWAKRNSDGSVAIYDSVEQAVDGMGAEFDPEDVEDIEAEEELLAFYREDGSGAAVDAAWVVHLLLSDPLADDWLKTVYEIQG